MTNASLNIVSPNVVGCTIHSRSLGAVDEGGQQRARFGDGPLRVVLRGTSLVVGARAASADVDNRPDTEPQNSVPSRRWKRAGKSSRASSAFTRSQNAWRAAGSTQKPEVDAGSSCRSAGRAPSRSDAPCAALISMICCVVASISATASGLLLEHAPKAASRLWARAVAVSVRRARSRWYTRSSTTTSSRSPDRFPQSRWQIHQAVAGLGKRRGQLGPRCRPTAARRRWQRPGRSEPSV